MKKHLVKTALVFLLLSVTTLAQAQIKFGVSGGGSLSSVRGFEKVTNHFLEAAGSSELIKSEMKVGYQVGLTMHIPISVLFFDATLNYTQQGVSAKTEAEANSDEEIEPGNFNMHYIKVPLHLGAKINMNPDTYMFFGAGLYGGYLFSADEYFKDVLEFKKIDFGLSLMGGVDWLSHRGSLSIEYGLVDLVGIDGWKDYRKAKDLPSLRNINIQLSYTFFF